MGFIRGVVCLIGVLALFLPVGTAGAVDSVDRVAGLTREIPPRRPSAMTGSEFVQSISGMNAQQREDAILAQLLQGNFPDFLRKLKPVQLENRGTDGRVRAATIFVMPDYLAIGSNADFIRFPINHFTAAAAATRLGFILPTRKMVDAVYAQSDYHLTPKPMTPGPQMSSTGYFLKHNRSIQRQCASLGVSTGELIAGHKKDVVLTKRLTCNPKRVAIYGWHRPGGVPIQPLSTVHGARYADYSHGARLVSDRVWIDGEIRSVFEILKDPLLSGILSDEGRIIDASAILRFQPDRTIARR